MKRIALFLLCISIAVLSFGQDCFDPPDGHTLYTTTDPLYNPEAITGFVTFDSTVSGVWTILDSTGTAGATFISNSGRTSTLNIRGVGTIEVEGVATDINDLLNPDSCEQTFNLVEYVPNVAPNPSLDDFCPLNIVLVIDESGSIEDNMSTDSIRAAVMTLANALNGSGSKMAIVEFETTARRVEIGTDSALQDINGAFIANLNTYLNTEYNPTENVLQLIGGTNWEGALRKADEVEDADFIIVLTDGRPTFYSVNGNSMGVAGEGLEFDLTALKEASDVANMIKMAGKHMFVVGLDFPADVQPIIDISGDDEFVMGDNVLSLLTKDYTVVDPNDLSEIFAQIAMLCDVPETVPTVGEWGLICLGLFLMIIGVVYMRQVDFEWQERGKLLANGVS